MTEMLTLAEIHDRFDGEWILISDPEFDERRQLIRGRVLWHSKDRDEVYRKDRELKPQSAAYVFTGPQPDNVLLNL